MWLRRKQASHGSATIFDVGSWATALRDAIPPLLYGLRLWASVSLALYVAFWLELDAAYWAGTTAALVCQPSLGASMRKGWFRMIGTVVGAVVIFLISVCFAQDRSAFLASLSLWCAVCALVATLLHNFAAYAAALAGYTAAIIASDELGAVGGTNGQVFTLTVDRASAICLGIVCAGVVMGLTDLGDTRRRLAGLFAKLSADIMRSFLATLKLAGPNMPDMHPLRRELIRQVVALDPTIDTAVGESAELLYHSPLLQRAVDGLLAALAGWRAAAHLLFRLQPEEARRDAEAILRVIPRELRSAAEQDYTAQWGAEPIPLRRSCQAGIRRLLALRAQTPTLRVLADLTARVLGGVSDSFGGLILAAAGRAGAVRTRHKFRLRVPDWLPSLVNAGRAFVVISTVEVFWIVSAWPNGSAAITWTAIAVVLFAPRADQAYDTVVRFTTGNFFAALFAAIVLFALLPGVSTFVGFSLVMGLYLVPVGALAAQSWQTAVFIPMAANFVPLVAPANVMSYDTAKFSNGALAIIAGTTCAAISFRLLPPLSPAFRTHRLLALSLRDLRHLAAGARWQKRDDWEDRIYGRVEALPDTAEPLQRARLVAALAAGAEILRLRRLMHRLELSSGIDEPLRALALGDPVLATARLARIDADLASHAPGTTNRALLRARGSILVLSDLLTQHAAYFGAGAL
jgi:uncharacterized membrane protein YccC